MGARTWGALLGLALLSTALGFVIYFRVLATAGATNVMLGAGLLAIDGRLLGVRRAAAVPPSRSKAA